MKSLRILTSAGLLASGLLLTSGASLTSAAAATVSSCAPAHLRVSLGVAQGAAGTIYHPVVFTNTGPTCSVFGVASIQPVVGGPSHNLAAVGPAARNASMGEMPVIHVVKKGQSVSDAFAVVETGNYTASTCKPRTAGAIEVFLGNFVRRTYVNLTISVCTARASTSTRLLAPGTTGY